MPLTATATDNHVFVANTYSKSALRAACEQVSREEDNVSYFPAFEIVTGMGAQDHFLSDRRNVSDAGIKAVVDTLFRHCELPPDADAVHPGTGALSAGDLARMLVQHECEESLSDPAASSQNRMAQLRRDK